MSNEPHVLEQIEEINHQIKELRVERARLKRLRAPRDRFPKCSELDLLIGALTIIPGIDRKGISDIFPLMKPNEVTGLLTKARRNRGLIENRGTRSHPLWYLVNKEELS